jgi:hypothetical protein
VVPEQYVLVDDLWYVMAIQILVGMAAPQALVM